MSIQRASSLQRQQLNGEPVAVAVVGGGPGGLTAAHQLALKGYDVTVFEAEAEAGGMLLNGIPSYRLPREIITREIDALRGDGLTIQCNTALGREIALDGLFDSGFKAVFLALGAHRSKPLNLAGENLAGIYPALEFLKSFNRQGESLARGRVGVIGGGNSAVDAARVALRQPDVEEVTILYRRTRQEMPAIAEEVDAAIEEGVKLETLISPARIKAAADGSIKALEFIRNRLGDIDASGRRKPVPIEGSEFDLPLDTLIVAIGDEPDLTGVATDVECTGAGARCWRMDGRWPPTGPVFFAGGDVVTGPNTVIDAIAAGKRVALMIDRYLRSEVLLQPEQVTVPAVFIEPLELSEEELEAAKRVHPACMAMEQRIRTFDEVELGITAAEAQCEARRCLRCDLDFTRPATTDVKKLP